MNFYVIVQPLAPVSAGKVPAFGLEAYFGRLSTGLAIRNPFRRAAFSPCLPNPIPEKSLLRVIPLPLLPLLPILCLLDKELSNTCPSFFFSSSLPGHMPRWDDTVCTALRPCWTGAGRALLACSFQDVMDRFVFARSRKIRPRRTLRHPTEKRKKADTRVNVSTWCERIAAPMLLDMPH